MVITEEFFGVILKLFAHGIFLCGFTDENKLLAKETL